MCHTRRINISMRRGDVHAGGLYTISPGRLYTPTRTEGKKKKLQTYTQYRCSVLGAPPPRALSLCRDCALIRVRVAASAAAAAAGFGI